MINSEIDLILLTKPSFYLTKKTKQKFEYLERQKSFQDEIKSNFHHFKKDSSYQKFSQTCAGAFKQFM